MTTKKQKNNKKKNDKKTATQSVAKSVPRGSASAPLKGGKPFATPEPKGSKNVSIPGFTLCQVAPFDEKSYDQKVPDECTATSGTAFSKVLTAITTGGTYAGSGLVFNNDVNNAYVVLTSASSTTWTAPATFGSNPVTNATQLVANYSMVRTVGWGIKIKTRQSYTNASGIVHIAQFPLVIDPASSTWQYPTSTTALEYSSYYRQVPVAELVENEIIVPGRYTDMTAFRYMDPNVNSSVGASTNGLLSGNGWMSTLVWYEGSISITNALDIEQVIHWEGFTKSAAGGVVSMTPAAPYSPAVLAATSYVTSVSPVVSVMADTEEDSWVTELAKAWKLGLRIANGVATGVEAVGSMVALL